MQRILKQKLKDYIQEHHPDFMDRLSVDFSMYSYVETKVRSVMPKVITWLQEEKPVSEVEHLALTEMTASLPPSKFDYVKNVLHREFPDAYDRFATAGVLTYVCLNLLDLSQNVFETFGFNEMDIEDQLLRPAVVETIHNYLT